MRIAAMCLGSACALLSSPSVTKAAERVQDLSAAEQAPGDAELALECERFQAEIQTLSSVTDDAFAVLDARVVELAGRLQAAGMAEALWLHLHWAEFLRDRCHRRADAYRASRRALPLLNETGRELALGGVLGNLGNLLKELGRLEEALEYFDAAERVFLGAKLERDVAQTKLNRGGAHLKLGRYERALSDFESARGVFRELGDEYRAAKAEQGRALVLLELGRVEEALDALDAAAPTFEALNDTLALAELGGIRGHAFGELGEHESALREHELALAHFLPLGDEVRLMIARINRAAYLIKLSRLEEAEADLDAAAEIARANGDRYHLYLVALHRAASRYRAGRLDAALRSYEEALGIASELGDAAAVARAEVGRAFVAEAEQRWPRALDAYSRAAEQMVASLRGEIQPIGESSSRGFRSRFAEILEGALRCFEQIEEPGEDEIELAWRVAQSFHGASSAALFSAPADRSKDPLPDSLAAERDEIQAGLCFAQTRRRELLSRSAPPSLEERASLQRDLDGLEAEIEALQARSEHWLETLRLQHAAFASARYPVPASSADVQAALPKGSALIELVSAGDDLWAFVLTHAGSRLVQIADGEGIGSEIERLTAALGKTSAGSGGGREQEAVAHTLAKLGQTLVVDLLAGLDGTEQLERLWLSPDGALCALPFEALLLETPPPGAPQSAWPFLVGCCEVRYVQSGTAYLAAATQPRPARRGRGFVGFANPAYEELPTAVAALDLDATVDRREWDPLPGSAREVLEVAAHFAASPEEREELQRELERLNAGHASAASSELGGEDFLLLFGAGASEGALKTRPEVREARVLHIACHAHGDQESSHLSYLALSGTGPGGEDGLVTTLELAGLDLSAELFVLSACETSAGPLQRFEGTDSLARAVLAGGSRSVLASLWKIPDAGTRAMMSSFYEAWRIDGLPLGAALTSAKRRAIANGVPISAWSAFTLWGRGDG